MQFHHEIVVVTMATHIVQKKSDTLTALPLTTHVIHVNLGTSIQNFIVCNVPRVDPAFFPQKMHHFQSPIVASVLKTLSPREEKTNVHHVQRMRKLCLEVALRKTVNVTLVIQVIMVVTA